MGSEYIVPMRAFLKLISVKEQQIEKVQENNAKLADAYKSLEHRYRLAIAKAQKLQSELNEIVINKYQKKRDGAR